MTLIASVTVSDVYAATITVASGMVVGLCAILLAQCFVSAWFPARGDK